MHPDAAQREAQEKHESALSAASERETERQVEHERERERVLERLKHVQDIEASHTAIAEAKRSQQAAEDAARQAARAQDIAEKSAEQAELAQQAAEAECEQLLATVDKLECQLLATVAAHAASSAVPSAGPTPADPVVSLVAGVTAEGTAGTAEAVEEAETSGKMSAAVEGPVMKTELIVMDLDEAADLTRGDAGANGEEGGAVKEEARPAESGEVERQLREQMEQQAELLRAANREISNLKRSLKNSSSPAAKLTGRSEHAGEVEATHEHRVLSAENKALAKKVNVLEEALADVSTCLDKTTAILRMQTTSFMQSVTVTRAVEELQRQEGAWRKDHEQLSAQIAAKQNECNLIQAQLQQLSAPHPKGGLLDPSIAGEDGIALSNLYEDAVKDMAQVRLRES